MKKKLISLALAGASLLSLAACGGGTTAAKGEVNVYNWGEYIDESIFDEFTAQTGIQVNYQTYELSLIHI